MYQGFSAAYRRMRALSLKSKLFILLILISLVPTLIVSFLSQILIIRSSTEYTASISAHMMDNLSKEMNKYLLGINETLNSVVIDSEFQKYISVPNDNIPLQSSYSINFRPLLQLLIQSKKEIITVLYLDRLGKIYSESQKAHLNMDYAFHTDPMFKQVFNMSQEGVLVPHKLSYSIFPTSNQEVFAFVKPVIDLSKKSVNAWIIVEIDSAWLQALLDNSKLGQNGQLLLYSNNEGKFAVFGDQQAPIYQALAQELEARSQNSTNTFIFSFEGKSYQVMHNTVPLGNLQMVGLVPLEEMTKGVKQAQLLTIVVASISFLAALLIAFPFMGIMLKPLYRLKSGMQLLGRGTSVPIKHSSQDEIGFLIETYNKMLNDLETMKEEVLKTRLSEKEKELLQLQAQINPHFLFNTLETIESYSLHNNSEAVSDMLQCVSRMMRYNVRMDGGMAPLQEEMRYTENFLNIHYYRYGKRVETLFCIEPELLQISIMKLSIQPFVENALKYGWSPLLKNLDFQITIGVHSEGKQWVFTVTDNGQGLPEHVMDILSELTASDGDTLNPYFKQHTGIHNVYRRYRLAYGNQFSMKFANNEAAGRGLIVEIRLPVEATWT
ncbi:cache domain-containing sensor histidine kinase [Paenibacillus sp. FSL H8-0034]|uniref:cache domain-containing sensor histidine kinase n=1 Tax=Paenibacillus sp. FSL H8-0034 TaxID=2954671 RepID=UPI0030FA813B